MLELTQLGKTYQTPNGPAVIVKDFNLRVARGEFVCVIGHSGCGKSTVISILMGLNDLTEGGVILAGKELTGPGTDRGVVFQSSSLLPWMTAMENVLLALDEVMSHQSRTERQRLAREYLKLVGLGESAESYPDSLSAGMRQRVGLARAFALEPKLLLLDEPFSLLDAMTRMELQDELMRLWEKDRKTVVMVTHDVDEALLLADRIVMMTKGPAATVGAILQVPFRRPRIRATLVDHPDYYRMRDQVLAFLDAQADDVSSADPRDGAPLDPYLSEAEEAKVKPPPLVSAEQLQIVERYTGLNRFRSRHRTTTP